MPNSAEFTNLKIENMTIIEDYIHKKVDIGKKFGFFENVTVHSLTDGLKAEYQNVLIVNPPNTITDLYRMVNKLVAVSSSSSLL